MLSFGSVTHKLALAAVPCLLLGWYLDCLHRTSLTYLGAQIAHAALQVRDGETVLFAEGGPQLDDIAIIDPGKARGM